MNKEYVGREEVIKILERYDLSDGSTLGYHSGAIECAIAEIEMLPAADVIEVGQCENFIRRDTQRVEKTDECYDEHRAQWIKENDFCYDDNDYCSYAEYSCSYCGAWVNDRSELPEYCPGCGKQMKSQLFNTPKEE